MEPKQTLSLSCKLLAKFPLKALTPSAMAYFYYNPEIRAFAKPVLLTVK
jgi:hypothetical protein